MNPQEKQEIANTLAAVAVILAAIVVWGLAFI